MRARRRHWPIHGGTDIALQVIDSDESDSPGDGGKNGAYQGRHRGADRLRQVALGGGVLAAVAALLAGGGTLLFWNAGLGDPEPLVVADRIGDLCESAVDPELLAPWADAEQAREQLAETKDEIRVFSCTYSAEHAGEDAYRLVTVFATVQVYESASDARAAHAGVLEFEASEGHETSPTRGVADQAATAVIDNGEETEIRVHAQEANATVAYNLFLTGAPPEGGDGPRLAADLAAGLISALPREGK